MQLFIILFAWPFLYLCIHLHTNVERISMEKSVQKSYSDHFSRQDDYKHLFGKTTGCVKNDNKQMVFQYHTAKRTAIN